MKTQPYAPAPGSLVEKAVKHIQALPPGVKQTSALVLEAIGHPDFAGLSNMMVNAVHAGLVRCERAPDNARRKLWSAPDHDSTSGGVQPHATAAADDDTRDLAGPMPTPNLAMASPFCLGVHLNPDAEGQVTRGMQDVPTHDRAPEPKTAGGFVCALDSNGSLYIQSDGHDIELPQAHTRKLLHYLDRIAITEE